MGRKVVYDSSNREQVKAAEKDVEDREKDFEWILSSKRGRRWLHSLINDTCHVHRLSHMPGDTHTTAFNEGARAVGLAVLEEIRTAHFAAFMKMTEENDDPIN